MSHEDCWMVQLLVYIKIELQDPGLVLKLISFSIFFIRLLVCCTLQLFVCTHKHTL